jgi:hypothetical protein
LPPPAPTATRPSTVVLMSHRTVSLLLALALISSILAAAPKPAAASNVEVIGAETSTSVGTALLELRVPGSAVAGDLLLSIVTVMDNHPLTAPTGWTLVERHAHARQMTQAVWARRLEAGDPSTYTFYVHDKRTSAGAVVAVRGAAPDSVASIVAASAGASRLEPVHVPDVAAEHADALLLGAFSMAADGTFALPQGMPRFAHSTGAHATGSMSLELVSERLEVSGNSGGRTANRSVLAGAVGTLLVIDRPSSTGTEPLPDDPTGPEPEQPEPPAGPSDGSAGGGDAGEPSDDDGHGLPGDGSGAPGGGHDDPDGDGTSTVGRWQDASVWPGGRVPTSDDDIVIDGHVVIEGNATARTVTVQSGGVLEFSQDSPSRLEVHGNVVVRGILRMQPASHEVEHLLRFVGVNESGFVGGGHAVVESDTGLWFTDHGHAMLTGSERLPWSRADTSLNKGTTTVPIEDVPAGWQLGDEIVITPTGAPGTAGHTDGYSHGRIAAIDGSTVTLDTPLAFSHPKVNGSWGAEVMNMTRNVRVEGTPGGRAHTMFSHTHGAQHLRNVAFRHMGPRQADGSFTKGVMGRYPLHFHHNGTGSEGTVVKNVVVRESGHRAFVPHASDGITFTGTIAHDVFDEAYWWDRRSGGLGHHATWERPSNRISYVRAIASHVKTDPSFRGHRLAGFELGHGNELSIIGSVAVGVQGNHSASGFSWPEGVAAESGDSTIGDHWLFAENVAHNNRVHGIFTWQNTSDPRHIVETSVLYHNGHSAIDHGAYSNRYTYRDLTLFGNGQSGLTLHAQGSTSFDDVVFDGGNRSLYGAATAGKHNAIAAGARLSRPVFRGYTSRAVAFFAPDKVHLDIVNPTFEGGSASWFHLANHVPTDSVIRVQLADGTAFRVHPRSSTRGTLIPEWNARREPIPPFA